jgi:hypothetical protein
MNVQISKSYGGTFLWLESLDSEFMEPVRKITRCFNDDRTISRTLYATIGGETMYEVSQDLLTKRAWISRTYAECKPSGPAIPLKETK